MEVFEVDNETHIYPITVLFTPVLALSCCKIWLFSCSAALKANVLAPHPKAEQRQTLSNQNKKYILAPVINLAMLLKLN